MRDKPVSVIAVGMPRPKQPKQRKPRAAEGVTPPPRAALAKRGRVARYAIDGRPPVPSEPFRPIALFDHERELLRNLSRHPDPDVRAMAARVMSGDSDALVMLHDALLDAGESPEPGAHSHDDPKYGPVASLRDIIGHVVRVSVGNNHPLSEKAFEAGDRAYAEHPLLPQEERRGREQRALADVSVNEYMASRPDLPPDHPKKPRVKEGRRGRPARYMAAPAFRPQFDWTRPDDYTSIDENDEIGFEQWTLDQALAQAEEALASGNEQYARTLMDNIGYHAHIGRWRNPAASEPFEDDEEANLFRNAVHQPGVAPQWQDYSGYTRAAMHERRRRQAQQHPDADVRNMSQAAYGSQEEPPEAFDQLHDRYLDLGDDRNANITRSLRPYKQGKKGRKKRRYMAAPAPESRPRWDMSYGVNHGHHYVRELLDGSYDHLPQRIQNAIDGVHQGNTIRDWVRLYHELERAGHPLAQNVSAVLEHDLGRHAQVGGNGVQSFLEQAAGEGMAPEWRDRPYTRAASHQLLHDQTGRHPDPVMQQLGADAYASAEEDPVTFAALSDYHRDLGDDANADLTHALRPYKQGRKGRKERYAMAGYPNAGPLQRPYPPQHVTANHQFDTNMRQMAEAGGGEVRRLAESVLAGDNDAMIPLLDAIEEAGITPAGPNGRLLHQVAMDILRSVSMAMAPHAGQLAQMGTQIPFELYNRGREEYLQPLGDNWTDEQDVYASLQGVRRATAPYMASRPGVSGQQPPLGSQPPQAQPQAQQYAREGRGSARRAGTSAQRGRVDYGALRSPAGGVVVRGIHYPGGKWIPAQGPEKASYEQWEKIHKKYQRSDGSCDFDGACRDGVVKYSAEEGFSFDPDAALFEAGPSPEEAEGMRCDLDSIETPRERADRLAMENLDASRQRDMARRTAALDRADADESAGFLPDNHGKGTRGPGGYLTGFQPRPDEGATVRVRRRKRGRARYAHEYDQGLREVTDDPPSIDQDPMGFDAMARWRVRPYGDNKAATGYEYGWHSGPFNPQRIREISEETGLGRQTGQTSTDYNHLYQPHHQELVNLPVTEFHRLIAKAYRGAKSREEQAVIQAALEGDRRAEPFLADLLEESGVLGASKLKDAFDPQEFREALSSALQSGRNHLAWDRGFSLHPPGYSFGPDIPQFQQQQQPAYGGDPKPKRRTWAGWASDTGRQAAGTAGKAGGWIRDYWERPRNY